MSLTYMNLILRRLSFLPSIKVAKYSPLIALYLTKSTSKIFEVNEYLELKDTISDFTNFLKEKYSEYEKNYLGF